MRVRYHFYTLFLLLCLGMTGSSASAQGVSSSGTDFWLAFMPNGPTGGRIRLELFIASSTDNVVHVAVGGSVRNLTMKANTVLDVHIDQEAITKVPETPTKNAVHVTSSNPITMYGYSVWGSDFTLGGSPDGFLALPLTAYGTKYLTVNYYDSQFGGYASAAEFVIVAPYDGTKVTITPKGDVRGPTKQLSHSAGRSWTVTLAKGETYLVQSMATDPGNNDLTGSLIETDKPVAVLSGHEITPITLGDLTSADHLLEMLPPVDKWGTQYFDMPMAGRTVCGDYIRILSAEDGNQITYNGRRPLLLNAGEFAERDLVNEPEVYTSINNKKFIVIQYSYSQGFHGDPGTADPFMILMTAQEQFEKQMVFRTPAPAQDGTFNNYVTFIAQADSIKKIQIDGKLIGSYQYVGQQNFPNTDPVMAAYRIKLPGGERAYHASAPVPFGAYQYGFATYEGYGWPTGMAQKIISKDTLPPLSTPTPTSCGNYTLRFNEPRTMTNGYSFDDTRISSISLITDAGDPRWNKPSVNYNFVLDPNFLVGDSVTTATLTVIDPTQDGYAAVYAVDKAGNDTVYEFSYDAPKIALSPVANPYDFGALLIDKDSCVTVHFTNGQATEDFALSSARVQGVAKGGTFNVSPTTFGHIAPGKSVDIQICYQAADTGLVSQDTVILTSDCSVFRLPVQGQGVTPLIRAEDLNFGAVDSGKTLCKPLRITNPGTAPLTITAQDLVSDPNFSVDPSQVFPIVIPPGGSVQVSFCFHPQSWGSFVGHVNWLNRNPARYAHSIKDTSQLIGVSLPAGAKLTSFEKDFGTPSCTDKPILIDTLYNDLPSAKEIDSVGIAGPDAKYFTIVSQQPTYPYVLSGNNQNPVEYRVQFNPMLTGLDLTPRHATLVAYVKGGGNLIATLTGTLTTPIVNLPVTSVDAGTGTTGQTTSTTFTIENNGNAPLTVNSYNLTGADALSFTLAPAPPYVIAANGKQIVTVTLLGTESKRYAASLSLDAGCNTTSAQLSGLRSKGGDLVQGTIHPKTYTGGCRSDERVASFQNLSSNDPITLLSVSIGAQNGWNDVNDFTIAQSVPQQDVAPNGGRVDIPITFQPTGTGVKHAALIFNMRGKSSTGADSNWTEYAELQGEAVAVQRVVALGTIGTMQTYHDIADGNIDVPVVLNTPIDQQAPDNGTLESYGYRFDVSWSRDLFRYEGVKAPAGISIQRTNTTFDPTTNLETSTFEGVSSNPLAGGNALATISLKPMLAKIDTTLFTPANVEWLDKNAQTLCYVATATTPAAFVLDPSCGTSTIQNFLRTGAVATSIRSVAPNPAHEEFSIDYEVAQQGLPITLQVYDLMGNVVASPVSGVTSGVGKHRVTIDARALAAGSYVIRLTDGKRTSSRRVVIQK